VPTPKPEPKKVTVPSPESRLAEKLKDPQVQGWLIERDKLRAKVKAFPGLKSANDALKKVEGKLAVRGLKDFPTPGLAPTPPATRPAAGVPVPKTSTKEETQKRAGEQRKSFRSFDAESAEKWGGDKYGKYNAGISQTPEGKAVYEYSTARAFELNGKLRAGDALNEGLKTLDENLGKAIEKAPAVPEDVKVHRYVARDVLKNVKIGAVFKEKGYTSTALDRDVVDEFVYEQSAGAVMSIRVGKGTKAMFLTEDVTAFPQTELLLPKNTTYRVLSRKEVKGGACSI
jgi:hypothetical protein